MLRLSFWVLCLIISLYSQAQDQRYVDSLHAELAKHPEVDSLRAHLLKTLWDATANNDLPRSETYARQLLREGENAGSDYFRAMGYRLLAISKDYQGQKDSAVLLYRTAIGMYRDQGNDFNQGVLLYNLASFYQEQGQFDSAWAMTELAKPVFAAPEYANGRARFAHLRATLERERGNYERSIAEAVRAHDLAVGLKDSFFLQDVMQGIALTYVELGDYPVALRYFEDNLAYQRRVQDDYSATYSLLQIGEVYWKMENMAEAARYHEQALSACTEMGYDDFIDDVRTNLGGIYLDQGKYEAAEKEFLDLLPRLSPDHNFKVRANVLLDLSATQRNLGKLTAAEEHAREGLRLAGQYKFPKLASFGYEQLAAINAALKRYPQAFGFLERKQFYQDSLYQDERTRTVAEFTARFEREKQDRLIGEQKSQLALLESNARADRLQRLALVGGIIALLALLAAGWYSYRQRHQRQELEKARLADEVKAHQKELSAHALQMAQKGQLLDQLSEELRQFKGEHPGDHKKLDGMLRELSSEERIDQDWANFRTYFQGVHGDFEDRLKAIAEPKLSTRELRLAALIKMQLTNQEVGSILGVTQDSLYKAKYRLRKKLPGAKEGMLDDFLIGF